MTESNTHRSLVSNIKKYIEMVFEIESGLVLIDDGTTDAPPLTADNYRPDLYYEHNNILIIGEAKTNDDIENSHSYKQIESYLTLCNNYDGNAILIISVPIMAHAKANNIARRIMRSKDLTNLSLKILTEEEFVRCQL